MQSANVGANAYLLATDRLKIKIDVDVNAPADSKILLIMSPLDSRDYFMKLTSVEMDSLIAKLVATRNGLDACIDLMKNAK